MRCLMTLFAAFLVCLQASAGYGDVLWDQSRLARPDDFTHSVAYYDRELSDVPSLSTYMLAGVTVPRGGWRVGTITVFFAAPTSPREWAKVARARLNVFAAVADLPRPGDDPRAGRLVPVSVRVRGGAWLVEASGLSLDLAAGRYWVGLTPVSDSGVQGNADHLRTRGRSTRGVESVVRQPGGDGLDFLTSQGHGQSTDWLTLQVAFSAPFDESMAIRIEGRRLPEGRGH